MHLFFLWPPGEGACRFLYRDNNMMQIICKLLFVWRRKLVLSSSSRLCQTWYWSGCLSRILHDWMKTQKTTDQPLTQQHKISLAEQFHIAWMKMTTQNFWSQEPRWNSSATTAQQLLDYTAIAFSIQRFNLSLSYLSPFGCNKVTTSVREVLVIPV